MLGLRTLCLAYRVVPKAFYESWAERFKIAQASIEDREHEVDAVADEIEKELTLMGATAIEDKLQDGVPNSIATLAKAGIKIWVLTGDKMETAINIGFSCNLLRKNMTLIVIKTVSVEDTFNQLREALVRFWDEEGLPREDTKFALIIDGQSLTYIFDESNDRKRVKQATLLELACRCKSVICCRVSPLQKAQIVKLVRKGLVFTPSL
jgi:phospholipid-translocating ATPase